MTLSILACTGCGGSGGDQLSLLEKVNQTRAIRILPLGDSLTHGGDIPGGYRIELSRQMVAQGVACDFVGSQSNGPDELVDKDHEGHPGWRIDQVEQIAAESVSAGDPDVVLLLVGTNDIVQQHDLSGVGARMKSLLQTIYESKPSARILVAALPPLRDFDVSDANLQIRTSVEEAKTLGIQIEMVDLDTALSVQDLTEDGIHPGAAGYAKMGQAFWQALRSLH